MYLTSGQSSSIRGIPKASLANSLVLTASVMKCASCYYSCNFRSYEIPIVGKMHIPR